MKENAKSRINHEVQARLFEKVVVKFMGLA
jgi:hypothetical protein